MRLREMACAFGLLVASCASVPGERELPQAPPVVVGVYVLQSSFASTQDALATGRYEVGFDPYISDASYPLRPQSLGAVRLVALDLSNRFDRELTPEEICTLAQSQGYEAPQYEDALRFAAEFPQEGYDRPIAFLHQPDTQQGVICLRTWQGARGLGRCLGSPSSQWGTRRYVFVFRQPAQSL